MTDVNKTLEERGARYGSFEDHAIISQGLLDAIRKLAAWEKLEPDMRQAISTIFDKIARIMNGDPYYTDNWHDIQGYARLVEARLLKLEEGQKARLFDNLVTPSVEWEHLTTPGRPNENAKIQRDPTEFMDFPIETPDASWISLPSDARRMPIRIPEDIRNDADRREGRPLTFPEIDRKTFLEGRDPMG